MELAASQCFIRLINTIGLAVLERDPGVVCSEFTSVRRGSIRTHILLIYQKP
jgi:hypothetical protein